MQFPAYEAAFDDKRFGPEMFKVYRYFAKTLDFVEFRKKKLDEIALGAGVGEGTVGMVVDRLVRYGYLHRGPKVDRVCTYRLYWSVALVDVSTKTA